MLYIREGFPEINEIVKCIVTKIYGNTVFVNVDEYKKEGILTISEVAPGRIRNLREYVVKNKTIICKVLRVDKINKRIDVSLRRVPIIVMKDKLEIIKKEEFSERVYKMIGEKLNLSKDELFEKTYEEIFDEFDTIYSALENIMMDNSKISIFKKLTSNQKDIFVEIINEKIKPEIFIFKKKFYLQTTALDGVDKIKEVIEETLEEIKIKDIKIIYLAAGKFEATFQNKLKIDVEKQMKLFFDTLKENSKKQQIIFRI